MGRDMNKSDRENIPDYIHSRNAICSANFLKALRENHGDVQIEAEPKPEKHLPPIPDKAVAAAAEVAFPDWIHGIKRIQYAVCREYGISLVDLCSRRRSVPIVRPRQVAMYLCKTLTNRSFPEIGRRFGGRDHSTIISAIRRIETICAKDDAFRERVEKLAETIG